MGHMQHVLNIRVAVYMHTCCASEIVRGEGSIHMHRTEIKLSWQKYLTKRMLQVLRTSWTPVA